MSSTSLKRLDEQGTEKFEAIFTEQVLLLVLFIVFSDSNEALQCAMFSERVSQWRMDAIEISLLEVELQTSGVSTTFSRSFKNTSNWNATSWRKAGVTRRYEPQERRVNKNNRMRAFYDLRDRVFKCPLRRSPLESRSLFWVQQKIQSVQKKTLENPTMMVWRNKVRMREEYIEAERAKEEIGTSGGERRVGWACTNYASEMKYWTYLWEDQGSGGRRENSGNGWQWMPLLMKDSGLFVKDCSWKEEW